MSIHYELSMTDYLRDPGLGSSALKVIINETPKDFKYRRSVPFQDTKSTTLGTAVHTAILERHKFNEQYVLQPEDWGPLNKNPGHGQWKEFKELNRDKVCLNWEDATYITKVMEAVNGSKALQEILKRSNIEVTGFCEANGVRLKARSDLQEEHPEGRYLWDLKTTSKPLDSASLNNTVFTYGYHFQAAHHLHVFRENGMSIAGFGWIFVSTAPGAIHIACRRASPELLERGHADFRRALDILEGCEKLNYWPGREENDYDEITIPAWAL